MPFATTRCITFQSENVRCVYGSAEAFDALLFGQEAFEEIADEWIMVCEAGLNRRHERSAISRVQRDPGDRAQRAFRRPEIRSEVRHR